MLMANRQTLSDATIEEEVRKFSIVSFKIQDNSFNDLSFNDLRFFPDKKQYFKFEVTKAIADSFKVKQEDVKIFGLSKGSIKIQMLIRDLNYKARDQIYIRDILSAKGLEPQELQIIEPDFLIESFQFTQLLHQYTWLHYLIPQWRGPRNNRLLYYVPYPPWFKIGMQVKGQFDNGNDGWLKSDTNYFAWQVAFYACSNLDEIDLNQIVITKRLEPNTYQPY
eukprot:CAMPEP_0170544926 /NCGR_PEP_ID=MMETSP0211-20121228/3501_1 /TAXON_ID=311385 /ORGANISM="Pseudokeronopsis sp., Strain OXSARD2" /LENGTH=221 /DNA_ID=CAMNT_0010848693 /DNA_START=366 /DNA_END=1031 /DNA_ORIENTATION=+